MRMARQVRFPGWRHKLLHPSRSNPESQRQPLGFTPRDRALGYADIVLFFSGLLFLALAFRVVVRTGLLQKSTLALPPLPLQVAISLFLILELYWIVRVLHGPPVWSLLGWNRPKQLDLWIAALGGASLALLVDVIARATTPGAYPIRLPELVLLDVILGPFVEESVFRGCLQAVVTRNVGQTGGILATAVVFASLHQVATPVEWFCLMGTGTAYGWMRMKSKSTTAAACMHSVYNLALFFCQFR
jgi:membrane protease YdiL (CAAX protease family)